MVDLTHTPQQAEDDVLELIWAKSDPYHAVWRHLLDAAAVGLALVDYFGGVPGMPTAWVAVAIALHDLGKVDPLFQAKVECLLLRLPAELRIPRTTDVAAFRHEVRSAHLVRDLLSNATQSGLPGTPMIEMLAKVTAQHHSRFGGSTVAEERGGRRHKLWAPIRRRVVELVVNACSTSDPLPREVQHTDGSGVKLLGLTVVSDWIASNPAIYKPPLDTIQDPKQYLNAAKEIAKESVRNIRLVCDTVLPHPPSWSESWPGWQPRGVQRVIEKIAAEELEPGLVIIEASTGEGKTEAALHLADTWLARGSARGIYIALPTQATSNQMHMRVHKWLERRHPGMVPALVHGMAWLMDDVAVLGPPRDLDHGSREAAIERGEAAGWLRNSRRALLAPFAVGTVDQVLLAALGVRFGVLRLLGLSNKVLVVDEVHACDTFMRERLKRALEWCRVLGTPVILLSATLPREQRRELIEAYLGRTDVSLPEAESYPLVTTTSQSGAIQTHGIHDPVHAPESRTVRVYRHAMSLTDDGGSDTLAKDVSSAVASGGCAAVIVNTVGVAQRLFEKVRAIAPEDTLVYCFHSRFPAWRRAEIEHEIEKRFGRDAGPNRPSRAIVIATQVIEQSLDIDFDVMFTELAPIDLILQRAGRLWRHKHVWRPVESPILHVIVPPLGSYSFGKSAHVYSRLHLVRTLGVLEQRDTLCLPTDYRPLIETVYTAEAESPCGTVPLGILSAAAEDERRCVECDRRDAAQHLIGRPCAEEFHYPDRDYFSAEGDEGEVATNLRAATRQGDYTCAVLALTRTGDVAAMQEVMSAPKPWQARDAIRQLMWTRVAVPKWWLNESAIDNAPIKGADGPLAAYRIIDLTRSTTGALSLSFDYESGVSYERAAVWGSA